MVQSAAGRRPPAKQQIFIAAAETNPIIRPPGPNRSRSWRVSLRPRPAEVQAKTTRGSPRCSIYPLEDCLRVFRLVEAKVFATPVVSVLKKVPKRGLVLPFGAGFEEKARAVPSARQRLHNWASPFELLIILKQSRYRSPSTWSLVRGSYRPSTAQPQNLVMLSSAQDPAGVVASP
jgi:hypothetical protein